MILNGSQIVMECLKEQGVDTVFGYPGGTILNIYDELYKNADDITHILVSHEQGAAHAADGYARSTGKVGVCMATSGPGATNLVTGIATCLLYTSDAADDSLRVDLGGRRIIKKNFFKQKTAYEIASCLVGSEMCIRDS